jgi:hypothetical protein
MSVFLRVFVDELRKLAIYYRFLIQDFQETMQLISHYFMMNDAIIVAFDFIRGCAAE